MWEWSRGEGSSGMLLLLLLLLVQQQRGLLLLLLVVQVELLQLLLQLHLLLLLGVKLLVELMLQQLELGAGAWVTRLCRGSTHGLATQHVAGTLATLMLVCLEAAAAVGVVNTGVPDSITRRLVYHSPSISIECVKGA